MDPGPEIGRAGAGDPAARAGAGRRPVPLPESSPACPYRGLTPYDVDDADEFFGRDVEVGGSACAACRRPGVLAVVGPSGCGKSSLVRAGVAAALRREGRTVVVMTPGRASDRGRWQPPCPARARRRCWWWTSARRSSRCARTRPSGTRSSTALADHADGRAAGRGRCARTGSVRHLVAPGVRPAGRADGMYVLRRDDRDGPAGGDRGAGPAGRRFWSSQGWSICWSREVEGQPGALPLMSHALRRDVAAPRGPHPHRGRLPRRGRHPGGRRAVGRTGSTSGSRPSSARCCAICCLRLVTPGPDRGAGPQPPAPAAGRRPTRPTTR